MNKEMKRSFRNFILKILAVVFVLAMCYFLYAFVYRARTELPAKAVVTNRGAAVYTLRGQMQMLSQKEAFSYFAFDGREKEKEYGTYVIPGLKNTRTLLTEKGATQAMCTSMTPQGLAVTEDYVLVSAYCSTYKHNSVIYVIDKETHNFIKEVVLPGQPHAGGLAYDPDHKILWYSSNINGIAQTVSLYGIVRDSFMTFYKGCLYVGCFEKYNESVIARYGVDAAGNLINTMDEELGMNFEMAVPLDYSTISEQVQGIAFYNDKLLISHSFGILPSRLVVYEQSDKRLYVNENSARTYRFPERLEQIVVEGDNLYVMFESCAYAYRASSVNIVDRVLKLSLPKMEAYEEESDSLFSMSE